MPPRFAERSGNPKAQAPITKAEGCLSPITPFKLGAVCLISDSRDEQQNQIGRAKFRKSDGPARSHRRTNGEWKIAARGFDCALRGRNGPRERVPGRTYQRWTKDRDN